jgi:hypothetical protein
LSTKVYDLAQFTSQASDATLSIELELKHSPRRVASSTYTSILLLRAEISLTLKAVDNW